MAVIKDFKRIVNDMKNFLHSVRPNVDTSPGSYTRDVIIDAPSNEMANLYTELSRTSSAQSPEIVSVEDIEKLGRNFQVYRKTTTPASGFITFWVGEPGPATSILIPRGTVIASKATADGTANRYVTTQDVTLTDAKWRTTGRFEVDAPIRATVGGTSSNAAGGTILALIDPIVGVTGVYNGAPLTNGTDFEPLATYRSRIKSAIIGNNTGTASGYYQTIIRIAEVLDAKVAAVGSGPEELRRNDTGAVDIYVRGLVTSQATTSFDIKVDTSTDPFEYFFPKQPIDITSTGTMSIEGSTTGAMVEGVNYTITRDTSVFGGTTRGSDKITIISSTFGETITIIYTYNSLVESLQTYMEDDARKILGADLLVSAAFARQIDTSCTVRILAGFTAATVTSNIEINLQTALNTYQIGEEVQQSDIVSVITNTSGVDDVTLPLDTFTENVATGTITQNSSGNIEIPANSYAAAGTIVVTVRS